MSTSILENADEIRNLVVLNESRYKAVLKVYPDMLFIYNRAGIFVDCHTNEETNLIMKKASFIGKSVTEIMPSHIARPALKCIQRTFETESLQRLEYEIEVEGDHKYFETRMIKSSEDEVLAIVRDVTDLVEKRRTITELSNKDLLTGVFNRKYFEGYFQKVNNVFPTTLMMVDVNGLKLINDAFGHKTGDQLLKQVSQILIETCPNNAVISRIGGDEFAVLLTNYDDSTAEVLVNSIYDRIAALHVHEFIVSVSIGWETRTSAERSRYDQFIVAENNMFRKKLTESQSMRHKTVDAIMRSLKEKNVREKVHSEQVAVISSKIAKAMGFKSQEIKEVELSGLLHDIGKIGIPEDILNKQGALTDEEYQVIQTHPEIGYQILKSVDEYSLIANEALAHHERYDGKGYPLGIGGENIPLTARIIAVADAYEAMVSDRAYRKGRSHEAAVDEIEKHTGTQFDPKVVSAFLKIQHLI